MTISVQFDGGPLHGMTGKALNLPQLMVFFDQRQKTVFLYKRVNEVGYAFLPIESKTLTDKYDESFEKLGGLKSIEAWD